MLNINKKAVISSIMASMGAVVISGQTLAANQTATSTARIYQAMTLGAATTLVDFGILTPGAPGGAVSVLGNNTLTVGASGATATAGTPSAATFAVGGLASAVYTIDLATGSSVNLTSGADTMAVSYTAYSFNADNTYATASVGTATLDGVGADTLRVGSTITVGAAQAAGTYTGTLSVTVDYQ